jgi:hypothetical protein
MAGRPVLPVVIKALLDPERSESPFVKRCRKFDIAHCEKDEVHHVVLSMIRWCG